MDGADFVDLHGEIDGTGKQDNVTVAVPIEYLSSEAQALAEEELAPEPPPGVPEEGEEETTEAPPLTDEAIIDLLKNA